MAEDRMMAVSHAEYAALLEERDRLKAVLARIPESTILNVAVNWRGGDYTFWYGCGVCLGEHVRNNPALVTKRPVHWDPKQPGGIYMHEDWCPRSLQQP